MPLLSIETNRPWDDELKRTLVDRFTRAISEIKGDPVGVISIVIHADLTLSYGGDLKAPAAMLHLYNLTYPATVTTALTERFTAILADVGVPASNTYMFFHETTQPHLVSWKGLTLTQLREKRAWETLRGTPQPLDATLVGGLAHPDAAATPISGVRVELWDRHTSGDSDYLGWAWTDAGGKFSIDFSPPAAWGGSVPGLALKVYEPLGERVLNGRAVRVRYLIDVLPLAPASRGGGLLDVGTLQVAYYEYDTVPPFPFAEPGSIRMNYGDGAAQTFSESLKRWRGLGARLSAQNPLPTTEQVQVELDQMLSASENRTRESERKHRGSTRSDGYLVDRLLNGFGPALLKVDKKDPDRFVLSCRFDHLDLSGHLDLPNYRLELRRSGQRLEPTRIVLQFRKPGADNLRANGALQDPTEFVPEDDGWEMAKRVVRVNHLNIVAQLQGHVTQAHFNMEQYAIALLRNVHRNPFRDLLFPHVREVVHINTRGRAELLSEVTGSLIRTKPITMESQRQWIRSNLGRLDWKGWRPRSAVVPTHTYARVAALYWDEVVVPHVSSFFAENAAEIKAHWHEIETFGKDLVANSAPLLSAGVEEDPDPALEWQDDHEVVKADARAKAVSAPKDETELQQLACYVIFHLTLFHTWFHNEMLPDLAELRYSSPLRNGSMAAESDDAIMPAPDVAIVLATTVCAIANFRYGYMMRNEDGDVPPALQALLTKHRGAFSKLGFDIDTLRARLNS